MTRTEFIAEIRKLADNLEKGSFHFINLGDNGKAGYIFGNRNYGEVRMKLSTGCDVVVDLYNATGEEKDQFAD